MFSPSFLHLLPFLVLLVYGQKETKRDIVDALQVKHLLIDSFEGPLKYDTLELFRNVEDLQLKNSNFVPFNSSFLLALPNLRRLQIENNEVKIVYHDITGCCINLKEAEFKVNGNEDLREAEMKMIKEMKSLERLVLLNKEFTTLQEDNFLGANISDLTIQGCSLETIEDNAFAKLLQLERLDLEWNHIMDFKKEVFAPLKNVKIINLKGNLLRKLTTDQIPSLPNLEVLIVSYNPIHQFDLEGIRNVAPKLKKVVASGIDVQLTESGGVKVTSY